MSLVDDLARPVLLTRYANSASTMSTAEARELAADLLAAAAESDRIAVVRPPSAGGVPARIYGHAMTRDGGSIRCRCGSWLGASKSAAREAMATHRTQLWRQRESGRSV